MYKKLLADLENARVVDDRLGCGYSAQLNKKAIRAIKKLSQHVTSAQLDEVRTLRPDMDRVEEMFRIFERPDAGNSRRMADYIYELEKILFAK